MRRALVYLMLICMLLMNGMQSYSRTNTREQPKSHRKSTPGKQLVRSKRESRRAEAARQQPIKRNPRRASLFKPEAEGDLDRFDQPREALEWYLQKRLPKRAKELPIERYFDAKEKIKKMKRFSTAKNKNLRSQADTGDAEELLGDPDFPGGTGGAGAGDGSASTSGALGTWQALGPGNVGGRTRALVVDPVNPDVMYAAGVAGGIWKTTNAGGTWSPLNDFLANIAVTVLAMDPTDPNTIYAGTGEGYFNADGVRGAGIFKTMDAGAHWTRLATTASNANFFFINDIVVSPA